MFFYLQINVFIIYVLYTEWLTDREFKVSYTENKMSISSVVKDASFHHHDNVSVVMQLADALLALSSCATTVT